MMCQQDNLEYIEFKQASSDDVLLIERGAIEAIVQNQELESTILYTRSGVFFPVEESVSQVLQIIFARDLKKAWDLKGTE